MQATPKGDAFALKLSMCSTRGHATLISRGPLAILTNAAAGDANP